jgi:hypothetical protein
MVSRADKHEKNGFSCGQAGKEWFLVWTSMKRMVSRVDKHEKNADKPPRM